MPTKPETKGKERPKGCNLNNACIERPSDPQRLWMYETHNKQLTTGPLEVTQISYAELILSIDDWITDMMSAIVGPIADRLQNSPRVNRLNNCVNSIEVEALAMFDEVKVGTFNVPYTPKAFINALSKQMDIRCELARMARTSNNADPRLIAVCDGSPYRKLSAEPDKMYIRIEDKEFVHPELRDAYSHWEQMLKLICLSEGYTAKFVSTQLAPISLAISICDNKLKVTTNVCCSIEKMSDGCAKAAQQIEELLKEKPNK